MDKSTASEVDSEETDDEFEDPNDEDEEDEEDEEGRDAEEDEALSDMRIRTYQTLDQFLTAEREDNSRETDTIPGTEDNPIYCDTTSEATEEDRPQTQGQSGEEDDDADEDEEDEEDHVPQTQKVPQTRGQKQKTQTQQFAEEGIIVCDLYWVDQTLELQPIDKAENIPLLSSAQLKKAEDRLQCTKRWGSCTRQNLRVSTSTLLEIHFAFLIVVPRKDQKNDDLFPQPFCVFHPDIDQRNSFRLEEIPNKGLGLKTCGPVPKFAAVVPSWPPMAVLVKPPGVPFCCDLPNVNKDITRYILTDDYGEWAAVPAKLVSFKEGRLQMEICLDPTETRHLHDFMMANSSKEESMPTMAKLYATLTGLILKGKKISATAFLLVANRDLMDEEEATHPYEYNKQIQKLDAAKNAKETMMQQKQEDTSNGVAPSATETPAKRKLGQEHTAKRKLGQEPNAEATREVTSTQLHDTQVFAALYNEYDKAEKNMRLEVKAADERTEAQKAVTNWWKSRCENAEQTMRSLAWSNIALTEDNRIHKRQQRAVIRASHTGDKLKRQLAESEAQVVKLKRQLAECNAQNAELMIQIRAPKKRNTSVGMHHPLLFPHGDTSRMHSAPVRPFTLGSSLPIHGGSPAQLRIPSAPEASKGTPRYTPVPQDGPKNQAKFNKLNFFQMPDSKP